MFFVVFIFLTSCGAKKKALEVSNAMQIETLRNNLKELSKKGIMFGHHETLAYGIGWSYEEDQSDVKRVVQDYPAVFGWDLGHIEWSDSLNIDGVPFSKMKQYAKAVYKMGGLNTYSWHSKNPYNNNTSWDSTPSIKHILKDRKVLRAYKSSLDKVADFFNNLKDDTGKLIPVIFRPFHEHTGHWFWWGNLQSTPEEYITFWQLTVDYLKKKNVQNVLYGYSPSGFDSKAFYLERYPGDDYVDILGFDAYQNDVPTTDSEFVIKVRGMLEILKEITTERHKIMAITEFGIEKVPSATWWTAVLLPIVKDFEISHILMWRNANANHYYVPYPGQISESDFKAFYQDSHTIFQKQVEEEHIYQKKI